MEDRFSQPARVWGGHTAKRETGDKSAVTETHRGPSTEPQLSVDNGHVVGEWIQAHSRCPSRGYGASNSYSDGMRLQVELRPFDLYGNFHTHL